MEFLTALFGGAVYGLLVVYLTIYWKESRFRKRSGYRMPLVYRLLMKIVVSALICYVIFIFLILM